MAKGVRGSDGFVEAAREYGGSNSPPESEAVLRIEALNPARHSPSLKTRPVLLISALFDRVMSDESVERLRAAFPDADVDSYPTGHESFVYAMPFAVESALDWVEEACGARAKSPPPG